MEQLLRLIEADCTLTHKQLAAMTGASEEKVDAEVKRLEENGTIVGYKAVVDWDKTEREAVTALIEVKASDEIQSKVFTRLGADRVIIPEKDSAARTARTLLLGSYMDVVDLSNRIRLAELAVPADWTGRTLRQLDLRNKRHLNVAAVRAAGELELNWNPDEPLPAGCSLLVIADRREFDKLEL